MRVLWILPFVLFGLACQRSPTSSDSDLVREGRLALARGQPTRAVSILRKAVARQPQREDAHLLLARALERAGKPAQAEQSLREAITRRPRSADLWLALGRTRVRRGRFDAAIRALQRAGQLRPGDPETAFELGTLYERHRLWEVARSHFRTVIAAKRPDLTARAHRRLAGIARRQTQWNVAIDHLRQALRAGGASPDLHAELADLLVSAGRPSEALVALRAALRVAGGQPTPALRLRLGRVHRELGQHRDAVIQLQAYAAAKPKDATPLWPLAASLSALARHEEAYAVGVKALALAPGDARVQWMMVPLYLKRGLHGPARALLTRLAPVRAHDPDYWRYVGEARQAAGDHRGAREAFAKAVTLRPRDRGLMRALAFASRRAGRYAEAQRLLVELLKTDPAAYDERIHLAIAREHLGGRAAAQALLRGALRSAPTRPEAHLYLAWIALRAGAPARALPLARRADTLAKGRSAHALDVLASVLERLDQQGEARKVVDRALALPLDPGNLGYFRKRRARLQGAKAPRPR